MCSMKSIKIVPIFNQATPGIWDDFLRIRMATMEYNYNSKLTDAEIVQYRKEYLDSWRKRSTNIAFGAYAGHEMIGFVRASCTGGRTELGCLYVLPEYQNLHVGTRLLAMAENTASLYTNNIELVSLGNAESFYKSKQYKSLLGTNRYTKNIQGKGRCACIPIFNCNTKIARACNVVSPDFNIDVFTGAYLPMWVYVDIDGQILGYATTNPDASRLMVLKTKCNHPADWSRRVLTSEAQNYIAHREILHSR